MASALQSEHVVLACGDAGFRVRLFDYLNAHDRAAIVCPGASSLERLGPAGVMCLLVDAAFLAGPTALSSVKSYFENGVPVVLAAAPWELPATATAVQQAGIDLSDYVRAEDPPELVVSRLDGAIRTGRMGPSTRPPPSPQGLEDERNRVVVQLAGAIAHKLKQPMTVALGYLELMLDDPNATISDTHLEYLREIRDAVRTMNEVVDKLQVATRYESRPYAGTLQILNLDADQRRP